MKLPRGLHGKHAFLVGLAFLLAIFYQWRVALSLLSGGLLQGINLKMGSIGLIYLAGHGKGLKATGLALVLLRFSCFLALIAGVLLWVPVVPWAFVTGLLFAVPAALWHGLGEREIATRS